MTLEDLMCVTNDSAVVCLFSSKTHDDFGRYNGTGDVPEKYGEYYVIDVFAEKNVLCVEIEEPEKASGDLTCANCSWCWQAPDEAYPTCHFDGLDEDAPCNYEPSYAEREEDIW